MTATSDELAAAEAWFAGRGWTPFPFQRQVWRAYLAGQSGLVHAATGTGKTQAAWWGAVLEWMRERDWSAGEQGGRGAVGRKNALDAERSAAADETQGSKGVGEQGRRRSSSPPHRALATRSSG
jgi:hypothetical protein